MKVRSVMREARVTTRPEDGWAMAARLMVLAGVRHLPVVDGARVLGVISDRDILELRNGDRPVGSLSKQLQQPETVHPDDELADVAAKMAQSKHDSFPVVEGGKLVGLITPADLLTSMAEEVLGRTNPEKDAVRTIMTPNPETARLDDLLLDVVGRMAHRRIRHLPIIDGDGRVVGIVSDRDIRTATGELMARGDAKSTNVRLQLQRVADVARLRPMTVREDTPIALATRLIVEHRIGALPVVDAQDRLVGILSYLDILDRSRARPH